LGEGGWVLRAFFSSSPTPFTTILFLGICFLLRKIIAQDFNQVCDKKKRHYRIVRS
jgi:hypothetical protein